MSGHVILWVDLETTGLDLGRSQIVEAAFFLTDMQLEPLPLGHSVEDPKKGWDYIFTGQDYWEAGALQMHARNGLVQMSMRATRHHTFFTEFFFKEVFPQISDYAGNMRLGGSSPHFDRSILQKRAPEVEKLFHYRNYDVSTLREAAMSWGMPDFVAPPSNHRASDDIQRSIRLARHVRDWVNRPRYQPSP